MRAGRMKYKICLLAPTIITNKFGEKETDYKDRSVVWAERVKMSGRRSEEVREHFADYTTQWRIRDAHEVQENWRVRELGDNGLTYNVCAIEPNRERGMLTLICERLNE